VAITDRARTLFASSSGMAVSMAIMNAASYGFTIIAAPRLGTGSYGALIAVMNVLMVVSVGSLGLQATAARRISSSPEHTAQIERAIIGVTYRAALALGLLLLVCVPLIDAVLRLDSIATALIVPLAAIPLTVMGGQAGILQGERRWAALGMVYIAAGVPRLVLGTAFIAWRPTALSALVGVTIGMCVPVLVGWWALRGDRQPGRTSAAHTGMAILKESVHNGQALFAFFALSSVDIIVARNVLSGHDAGLYAAGLILTKAMLFLPQFVVVVAFPSMATGAERRRALAVSLGVVTVLGGLGTAAAWVLSGLAVRFTGGAAFAEIEPQLWLFAMLGTLLSLIQLLVYSVLARQGRRSVYAVWVALALVIGIGLTTTTLVSLVTVVVLVDLGLFLVLLAISAYVVREPAQGTQQEVDAPA
jgi:O-antigen/teichoic acid export membrane protein